MYLFLNSESQQGKSKEFEGRKYRLKERLKATLFVAKKSNLLVFETRAHLKWNLLSQYILDDYCKSQKFFQDIYK